MLPSSPLLQLVPARAHAVLARLRDRIWRPVGTVTIEAGEPQAAHRTWAQARQEPLAPVAVLPEHWGRLWDQRWFRLTLDEAAASRDDLYLAWDDQAEATLYVDGLPHYGFDPVHHHAPLPVGRHELWIEAVACQTGIWIEGASGLDPAGSKLSGARLLQRDDATWGLYHDLATLDDLMRLLLRREFGADGAQNFQGFGTRPVLGPIDPLLRRLLREIDALIDAYQAGGVDAGRARAAQAYAALKAGPTALDAVLTGHAHLDLVWLWPEVVGEFKAVRTFAIANNLMSRYPEFRFGYSQPASYEAVERRSPEMMAAVRGRMAAGQWDATGATEVESDTVLACGEALARSFLIGQRRFEALRGSPARVLWLPDVFGYSPCLPQIMQQCGVDFFYTTKLSWSAISAFPHTSFVWRGHDGSEVVTHLGCRLGYNQTAEATHLDTNAREHRQSDVHGEFLAPTGYGDGGGGTTEAMLERARRSADLAGLPRARWGNIEPFFDRLASRRAQLPTYQGELYLEYHRGTYTTHAAVKLGLRQAERALQVHEAVRCATGAGPIDEAAWRRVVFAQFHDYIPGSSIHEVYVEARAELAAIAQQAGAAARAELGGSVDEPAAGSTATRLFNPLPRPQRHRLGVDAAGRVEAVMLPPLAAATPADLPRTALAPVRATPDGLDNGLVQARFDAQGRVASLCIDGVDLALRAPLCELVAYPDQPHLFEAWDIDRQTLALGEPVTSTAALTRRQDGAGSATLSFTRSLGEDGEATLHYTLEAGAGVLRLDIELDWRRPERLLKLAFPTAYAGRQARYAAPFGSVLRSQVPGEQADEAKWEVPASRWAAVADETEHEGLFVVSQAKFGWTCRDGNLGLTLVRSAAVTCSDAVMGGTPISHPQAMRRDAGESYSDLGRHAIRLAFGLHRADAPRDEQAAAWADLIDTPPLPVADGVQAGCGLIGLVGGETLQPVWAQPLGPDTWVLRLNETLGRRGIARLRLAEGWRASRVDLRALPLDGGQPIESVAYGPYALVSVKVERVG
ncbi:alpha-mannosidase [Leptothrix discophora]|uniref:Glycoside hydrolase family 38 C-terminal domain-containing protein n=1 Tax=Leptothrix discophora TaxID=89 RepID=A0ABT9G173_LEPDI|nr:alpha-mannosidase [Leptothrix discophora]MDP4300201.1 glycoside hydrolase family 38 C-terminal domain-containing protein [Leptothrix discophora]